MDSRFGLNDKDQFLLQAKRFFGENAFISDEHAPMSCSHIIGLWNPDGEGEWTLLGSGPSFEAAMVAAVVEFSYLGEENHLPHIRSSEDAPQGPRDDWARQVKTQEVK